MALKLRPNCEYCDKDLPPNATDAGICTFECTFCADCVETKLHNVCPNCGGGFAPRPIRPAKEWRPGVSVEKHPPSAKRVHLSFSHDDIAQHSARIRNVPPDERRAPSTVIARSPCDEAIPFSAQKLDCFVASPHPTTERKSFRRQNCALDLAKTNAKTVALAPAAHDERIAVFEERALDAARELKRLGAFPADCQKTPALAVHRPSDAAGPHEIPDIHGAAVGGVVHELLHPRPVHLFEIGPAT